MREGGLTVARPKTEPPLSLLDACRLGRLDLVRERVAAGQSPDHPDAHGCSPLMMACCLAPSQPGQSMRATERQARAGAPEVVRWLLAQPGVAERINAATREGRTALFYAARDRPELVSVLLEHGANPDLRDGHGDKARDWAGKGGHLQEVDARLHAWRAARARAPQDLDVGEPA